MQINGLKILVTGGSSGIGKATALAAIQKGAKVIITGRDTDKLNKVAQEIGAIPMVCDVANFEEVDALFNWIEQNWKGLDVLVNNAGIGDSWDTLTDIKMEDMHKIYAVNVFGATYVAQKAAKIFKNQKSGDIFNIASTAASKGFANGSVYASSKFALKGLTQCWQAELRPFNIRVVLVNPSEVTTAFAQNNRNERPEVANKLRGTEIAHAILSCIEMDKRGYIPEITIHATNPF
jgi:3-oxoacyl-[acyl-carrier protein] reductase